MKISPSIRAGIIFVWEKATRDRFIHKYILHNKQDIKTTKQL